MSLEGACKRHGGNFYVKLMPNPKRHEYKKKPASEWTDEDMKYAQLDVCIEEGKRKNRLDVLWMIVVALLALGMLALPFLVC